MSFHVDKLEKRWLFIIGALVAMTWVVQLLYAARDNMHPPSNVEGIDSAQLHLGTGVGGGEFAEDKIGVTRDENGQLVVRIVAARYGFYPQRIDLPQGETFKLRIASFDVLHGVYVPRTNLNLMIVPGYVSEVETALMTAGEQPFLCHEFCGPAHAYMYGLFNVIQPMNSNWPLLKGAPMTAVTDHSAMPPMAVNQTRQANRLGMANMWVAFGAFALAIPMGLYQVAERADLFPALESADVYYASVSTHGVLMAYVLTTFFIMGFGYHSAINSLKSAVPSATFSWAGFYISLFGTVLAAYALLTGQASVMYTFYPPEMGISAFYIGAALLIIGSWFWCVDMIWMMTRWRRENPGRAVPLIMFGTTINAVLWLWTSMGATFEVVFQILPVTLGFVETIEAGLARTLFSWTLHAIVYFWLFPAYIAMYSIMPKESGGKLFSDEFARIAFVMLFIFSVPIGFHHLYMDPQQAAGWKLLHMFGTFMVAVPTLITGFTIMATMELSGRLRGGKGLLGWTMRIKWGNPVVAAAALAMLMLTFGGFGGVINASYSLNALIHNTQWVTGHFHLIFGGTTVIMYFAVAYWAWPKITGRELKSRKLALWQLWLWAIGMCVTTGPWHVLGLLGQPRRVDALPYGETLDAIWNPYEVMMLVGSVMLTVSAILFIFILVATHLNKQRVATTEVVYATAIHQPMQVPHLLNSLSFWNWAMLVYMLVSYGYPIAQFLFVDAPLSIPFGY